MNNIYEIPKRLKRKTGILGSVEMIDAAASLILGVIGFILAIVMKSLFGAIMLIVLVGVAYFVFILRDKYEENFRIKAMRMIEFSKKQKIFYYYRGTK